MHLISQILNGSVVTERQKKRRQARAEQRIQRAEMRIAKLKAKLNKMDK